MTSSLHRSRQFPHEASAVPAARHFVGGLLESAPTAFRQDVEVMVSELVSNCIRHTPSTFDVTVDLTSEAIRVEVTDRGGGTPRVGRPPPSQPTGRGLQIVDLLSDEWGVQEPAASDGGKTVWFVKARADVEAAGDLTSHEPAPHLTRAVSASEGDEEVPLLGGRLNQVVRIGETVRRPGGAWTPTVHALLRHLHEQGFAYAPEPFGWDDQGREVLSYMPGTTVGPGPDWPAWVWDEDLLADVGRVTAEFHRASAGFRPTGLVPWEAGPAELGPQQIVCHHDLAPYNLVFDSGRVRGIIDWDLAGPGTVRSELAFVAWQWVPFHDPFVTEYFGWRTQPDRPRRLRILLDAYGLEDRHGFIDDVIARVESNRDGILLRAGEGNAAYIRLVQQGHVEGMNRAVAFLTEERDHLAPD